MNDQTGAQFGLLGLGVMGAALARNIEDHGFSVAVWNHSARTVSNFLASSTGKRFVGATSLQELVASLTRPRRMMMMITAGAPIDEVLGKLIPLLDPGDIVVDGGNSWYKDTQRRESELKAKGIAFVGAGVSGGESGARFGPSLMPGGSVPAWEHLRPVFEAIAAKTEAGPCVAHLGPDGAGHFVKMVHNGIEYGDMQLIAEVYDLMRRGALLEAPALADRFADWNQGPLESFLVELTSKVLRKIDRESKRPLVDLVVDAAGQKGTGRWTNETALEAGIPVPTLSAALEARELSGLRSQRLQASGLLRGPTTALGPEAKAQLVEDLPQALLSARICAYAQGMSLISAVSQTQGWGIRLEEVARIWKGGCILRARLLDSLRAAYQRAPELANLLIDPELQQQMDAGQAAWRRVVATAVSLGIPCPALGASLSYFDSYRCATLPQNLIQAQRDAFGAHTYQRIDRPELGFLHTPWLESDE